MDPQSTPDDMHARDSYMWTVVWLASLAVIIWLFVDAVSSPRLFDPGTTQQERVLTLFGSLLGVIGVWWTWLGEKDESGKRRPRRMRWPVADETSARTVVTHIAAEWWNLVPEFASGLVGFGVGGLLAFGSVMAMLI